MKGRRTAAGLWATFALVAALVAATTPAGAGINEGDPPVCMGFTATIWGDDGHNRLFGTDKRDVIHGMGGRDRIFGGGGGDIICGGDGADVIKGQRGQDKIDGGDGRDRIVGGTGADLLIGGRGNDQLNGGFGNDDLRSGPGFDLLGGAQGTDTCDFDKQDTHFACEEGDVIGGAGVGVTDFMVDVPRSFAVAQVPVNGTMQPVYVFDTLLFTASGQPANLSVEVKDAAGTVLFSFTQFAPGYGEQTFVVGQPKTVTLGGTGGGYAQAGFRKAANVPFFAEGVTYGGSRVFRLRDPIPAKTAATLTLAPLPPFTQVAATVRSLVPGSMIALDAGTPSVSVATQFVGGVTEGTTAFEVRTVGGSWSATFTP